MELRAHSRTVFRRWVALALLASASAIAADPPITPVTVCEIVTDLAAHEGKEMAVLGRYSFRRDGRWMGEDSCDPAGTVSPTLWLTEDSNTAPKPPGNFELDVPSLNRKFADLLRHATLGKFRFGTPEYDRWAVVYGRVVSRKEDPARKPDLARKEEPARKAPADLLFRGNGVVIFLTTER
jgi:hypothetical protein